MPEPTKKLTPQEGGERMEQEMEQERLRVLLMDLQGGLFQYIHAKSTLDAKLEALHSKVVDECMRLAAQRNRSNRNNGARLGTHLSV
jgi:hypothetical protein